MIEIAIDQIQEEKDKRPIGFSIYRANEEQKENTRFTASHNYKNINTVKV